MEAKWPVTYNWYVTQTRAIRNARAEYSVEPAKRISASIVANYEVTQYISVSIFILSAATKYQFNTMCIAWESGHTYSTLPSVLNFSSERKWRCMPMVALCTSDTKYHVCTDILLNVCLIMCKHQTYMEGANSTWYWTLMSMPTTSVSELRRIWYPAIDGG